ncbi:gluconate 5-dehydrogenase [Panacagrimonas perspica]|uniref:Gluconate 5-dehydrogenase n=1 Tax=Panacagrimonas perspica TaxID=381431 RepID=A0A4R7PDE7_9GAMM|nr:SDR family oxidoreductase [Panacagrimonas perspica]TDU32173.1 gluconate 5-dehydrogenase [Panacagrimonas perspica]THD01128.1 gluconate 5-dehydrogenase [Panacagrimonas perspica]
MSIKRPSLFDLRGRTALITGGSRGLGLQMAEALGTHGARILLSARNADELRRATAHLAALDIDADWIASDASQESDIDDLADQAIRRAGRVDILVNNAGSSWGAAAEDYPVEAWDKVFDLNIRGPFLLTQKIGKRSMIPNRYGRIVNIASTAGLQGTSPDILQAIAYNSSKGALINFTRALAAEWGGYGITVNALAPGFFPSKLTNRLIDAVGDERMAALSPLNRLGDDEDLKGAALLFASDASKHITGQVLAIDGGATIV